MATLFEAYVTNAGKYSEGQLVGETLKFPTTAQEVEALLKRIGVDGVRYQEIFITSFDGDVLGLYDHLSEYENLDELNHLACLLSELTSSELETLEAVLDSGDHCSSVRDMQTDSRSRGQSESYSQNTQRLGRELMTPAELATMPGDKCILQLRGLPPFFSPKYDLKRHPNYRYTAEADKQKNAFDLDRLINRRRRPGLNEACTMYEVTVPDDALTEEDEDILNYDDIDDPDAFA